MNCMNIVQLLKKKWINMNTFKKSNWDFYDMLGVIISIVIITVYIVFSILNPLTTSIVTVEQHYESGKIDTINIELEYIKTSTLRIDTYDGVMCIKSRRTIPLKYLHISVISAKILDIK